MTNIFALVSVVAFSVNTILGTYVLRKNPGAAANRSFALLMGSFVLWDLSEAVLRFLSNGSEDATVMVWLRIEWTGISAIGGVLVHFVLSYPTKKAILEWKLTYALIYAPTFVIIGLVWFSDLVVKEVGLGPLGFDAKVGSGYPILAIIYTIQIAVALFILLQTYRKSEVQIIRKRSRILLMGVAVPVIVGSVTETFLPVLIAIETRLGVGSIYTVIMGIFAAYAIMKYKLLVIEPATEEFRPPKMEYLIKSGHNNLIEGKDSSYSYSAFRSIVSETPGLCITTTYPDKVRQRYGLEKTPIVWISKMSLGETTFKPSDLSFEVLQSAMKFMRDNPRTSILLEDLEYLTQVAGFRNVLHFVKMMTDVASAHQSTLIVPLNPLAMEEKELITLRKSFDVVREVSRSVEELKMFMKAEPVNSILYQDKEKQCQDEFKRGVSARRGLFITTTFPGKVTQKEGIENTDFIWISEAEGLHRAFAPSGLKYEVLREVTKFVDNNPSHIILFEGLEYLSVAASFSEVLEFLQSLIDLVSSKGTRLLVSMHPRAFSDREVGIVEKRFDLVVH